MYLHAPDRATPFEETCRAMDEAWREGKFRRWGVSNFTAGEVERVWEICERGGLVRPSVYQGRYNALVREGEGELFPVLRRLGIGFFAYRYVMSWRGERVRGFWGLFELMFGGIVLRPRDCSLERLQPTPPTCLDLVGTLP